MNRFFALIARLIGFLLLLGACAVLGHDLLSWQENGVFAPTATGQLWQYIHGASLSAIQDAVQRYLAPQLWDPVLVSVLKFWAVLVLAVPGFLLTLAYRKRPRA
jgi:hypothetical protein